MHGISCKIKTYSIANKEFGVNPCIVYECGLCQIEPKARSQNQQDRATIELGIVQKLT